ncbi:White collar 1 protein [Erysiphe neolycopersici]|uniref:White collar 1 protein n=1 Tax=Erysiphe neolycopersici TaxID=212602 RepID=A0A420HDT1_9PEZI|nr:White collar 1 protein [Erysiphe neolycopersici]
MSDLNNSQYSAEPLPQPYTTRRQSGIAQLNEVPSAYTNHNSPYLADPIDLLQDPTQETAGNSLDDIIRENDKEILRRQSLTGQFINNVEYDSAVSDISIEGSGLNRFQFISANEQTNLESRRRSSGVYESACYDGMEFDADLCVPRFKLQPSMHGTNVLMDSNQLLQSRQDNTFENMMSTSIGTDLLMQDVNCGIHLFNNQFSMCPESTGLNQEKSQYMITTPQQPSLSSRCESLPNLDTTNLTSPRTTQNTENEKTVFSSPINPAVLQSITNLSPSETKNSSNSFPHKNESISLFPAPSAAITNHLPEKQSNPPYQNIYCRSGFDLLGALTKVVSRKDPEIKIGKVDLSCAFTVCDALQYDFPIIYVSEVFEQMTGYGQYEVKGQNCRFLQSPDGKVAVGSKREFVDNDSVRYLKERILKKKEAQRSVINYRKGGQPFMNILTIIPITGEDDLTIRYFVGFQIDLVEMPASVQGKSANGNFNINYCQSRMPRYIWQSSTSTLRQALDFGQSVSKEDVSTVLASIRAGTESELMRRMWDKILIENTDDVVHVISLKGLFLYLSPSSRRVLEYDASELVGTALSSVCHPSDIVSVTRELKDTSTGVPVNVVFRIRRKKSGYTWFESHGSLCIEQGKGRKCIILIGRERPVYALDRFDIESAGGIGESEMWNKISISGMFLFVSSSVRNLLDRSPSDLIGTSIQALMRTESKVEFRKSLDKARNGKIVTHRHEILGKRGLMMQAQTTLFPGDASKGQRPTFLVAQTKLIKSSFKSTASNLSHVTKGSIVPDFEMSEFHDSSPLVSQPGSSGLVIGTQHVALASKSNIFDELKTTQCTSWQFELRQMEKSNRILAEELATLLSNKKKRKRRRAAGHLQRDCANCHTRVTPEWRRGPSGHRDLCNSCGLRYAKQNGRASARHSSREKISTKSWSSVQSSPPRQTFSNSQLKFDVRNTPSHMSLIYSESSEVSRKIMQPDISNEMTNLSGQTSCLAPLYEYSPNDCRSVDEISYGYGVEGE